MAWPPWERGSGRGRWEKLGEGVGWRGNKQESSQKVWTECNGWRTSQRCGRRVTGFVSLSTSCPSSKTPPPRGFPSSWPPGVWTSGLYSQNHRSRQISRHYDWQRIWWEANLKAGPTMRHRLDLYCRFFFFKCETAFHSSRDFIVSFFMSGISFLERKRKWKRLPSFRFYTGLKITAWPYFLFFMLFQ